MIRTAILPALVLCGNFLLAQAAQPPITSTPQLGVNEMSGSQVVTHLNNGDPAECGRVFPPTLINQPSATTWIRVSNGPYAGADLIMISPGGFTGSSGQGSQPEFDLDLSRWSNVVSPGGFTEVGVYFKPTYNYSSLRVDSFQLMYQADPVSSPGVYSSFWIGVEGHAVLAPAAWLGVHQDSPTGDLLYTGTAPMYGVRNLGSRVVSAGPGAAMQIHLVNEGLSGSGDIQVGVPVRVSGSADFVLDTTGWVGTLTAGASTSFSVSFDPATTAPLNAVFEFTHTDAYNTSPFSIEFIGTGTPTAVQLFVAEQPGNWWVTGSMLPFYTGTTLAENAPPVGNRDFGSVNLGGSASRVMQIDNGDAGWLDLYMQYTPGADLGLGTPTISGDADFTLNLAGYSTTVASAGTTSFQVVFTPQASGVRSAIIEIPHGDDSERTPFRVLVTGLGASGTGGTGGAGGTGGSGGSGSGCAAAASVAPWLLAVSCALLTFTRRRREA